MKITLDLDGTYFFNVDKPDKVPIDDLEQQLELYGDFDIYIVTGRPEEDLKEIENKLDIPVSHVHSCPVQIDTNAEGKARDENWAEINKWKVDVIEEIDPDLILENERNLAKALEMKGYRVICVDPVEDPLEPG